MKDKKEKKKEKKRKKAQKLFDSVALQNETMRESIERALQKVDEQADFIEQSASRFDQQNQQLGVIGEEAEKLGEGMNAISGKMDDLVRRYGKHDLAMVDVLDSMEEIGRESQGQITRMEKVALQLDEMLMRREKAEKEALISLCMTYQDQMDNLSRFASDDPQWSEQMSLVLQLLEPLQYKATFQAVGSVGEAIVYDWHEVLDVVETDDPAQDMHVAEVYERGYLYGGKVYRKARVRAYKLKKEEEKNEDE